MRAPWLPSLLVLIGCGNAAVQRAAPAPLPSQPAVAEPAPAPVDPVPPPAPVEVPLPVAPPLTPASAPPPHVVAVLAQVPAGATFVAGLDAARLSTGAAGGAMREMVAMFANLGPAACKSISVSQFGEMIIAGSGVGTEKVVFLGRALAERATADCLSQAVLKKNEVTIKRKKLFGRTVYYGVGAGADEDQIAWTKSSGPVIADRADWLVATLDPKAPKAGPDLVAVASSADHRRMVWVAALATPDSLARLEVPEGLVTGPVEVRAGLDLGDEIELDLDIVFSSAEEATRAGELMRAEFAKLRQDPTTAALVADLRLGVHGAELRLIVHYDEAATADLIQQFRAAGASSPPPPN